MRPTFSIIVFTTLSGIGYGLLFLVGLGLMLGWPTQMQAVRSVRAGEALLDPRVGLALAIAAGFVFSSAGLMASVAHLGKPLRAWRAFSQWRSSWLSREGISAVVAILLVLAIAALLLVAPDMREALRVLGVLLAVCSAFTVFCTARIYSSLSPIRAWHNRYTLPGYVLLGLYGGALWFCALHLVAHDGGGMFASWVLFGNVLIIAPACALLKFFYWHHLDALTPITVGAATGLGGANVRSFEQPHTEENYLTREMGFVLARKHRRRLRLLALWTIVLSPPIAIALSALLGRSAFWLVALAGTAGIFVERWLFFAEARHAVMSYYGR